MKNNGKKKTPSFFYFLNLPSLKQVIAAVLKGYGHLLLNYVLNCNQFFFLIYLFNLFFFIKSFFGFLVLDLYKCLFWLSFFFFPFLFVVLLKTNWKLVSLFVHMRVCRCSVSLSHVQCFLPQIFGLSKLCVLGHEQCKHVSSAFPCGSPGEREEQGSRVSPLTNFNS